VGEKSAGRNFLKVAVFSLAVIGCYTIIASYYSPIETGVLQDELASPAGAPLPRESSRIGAVVYNGKGACALCHEGVGARAPRLDFVAREFSMRLKDPAYGGTAKDAEGYLYESMTNPSAYVVKGYGVAGSDDKVSPMPDVSKEPIGLTESEIRAVMEYLKVRAGVEPKIDKEHGI